MHYTSTHNPKNKTAEHRVSSSVLVEHQRKKGFVALITVLIISSVMLVSVVSLAQYGMTTRFSLLNLENKIMSESLAHACIALANIAVVNDPLYGIAIEKVVAIESDSCTIESIEPNTPSSGVSRIKVSSAVPAKGATTNYQVDIAAATGAIVRFTELSN